MRLTAAIAVVFSHSFAISLNNYALDPMVGWTNNQMSFGDLAVSVFFIISGFLITQSYDYRKDPVYFLKARVLRIFPALIVVILLTTFIMGPILTTLSVTDYLKNSQTYLYLRNIFLYPIQYYLPGVFENNILMGVVNGSIWTLIYEVCCYAVVLLLGIFKMLKKSTSIILLAATICISMMPQFPHSDFTYKLNYLCGYFFGGMVLYMFREYIKVNHFYAVISLSIIILSANYGGLVRPAIPLFGAYLVYYFAFNKSFKLSNVSRYGDLSYGVYIYAFPVQQILVYLSNGKMNSTINFVVALIISLIFAFLSWHVVEKNAMKLRKMKIKKTRGNVPVRNVMD